MGQPHGTRVGFCRFSRLLPTRFGPNFFWWLLSLIPMVQSQKSRILKKTFFKLATHSTRHVIGGDPICHHKKIGSKKSKNEGVRPKKPIFWANFTNVATRISDPWNRSGSPWGPIGYQTYPCKIWGPGLKGSRRGINIWLQMSSVTTPFCDVPPLGFEPGYSAFPHLCPKRRA